MLEFAVSAIFSKIVYVSWSVHVQCYMVSGTERMDAIRRIQPHAMATYRKFPVVQYENVDLTEFRKLRPLE